MACKGNCAGCSDTLIGNTQKSLNAYIQPCSAGPRNPTYNAMTDGDWPAVKVTGKTRNFRGARTQVWRRQSDGTNKVCHVTEATPADNSITLQFADCGCGGYSPDELAEQGSFDLYEVQRCCGTADLEDGWSKIKVTRCISFSAVDESDSTSYDPADDTDLTRTYTGGIFIDGYTLYPLNFSEIAEPTGFDTGARITSAVYANNKAGCSTSCKDQCADAWYAVTDEGNVIYKTGSNYAIENSLIPGFVTSVTTKIAQVGNLLIVASGGGYWQASLDDNGDPGTWTNVVYTPAFQADNVEIDSSGNIYFAGFTGTPATRPGIIVKIDKNGKATTYYSNATNITNVTGLSICDDTALAVREDGVVMHAIGSCAVLTATPTQPPFVSPVFTDAFIRPGGEYWVSTATEVFYSDDAGVTWNKVAITVPAGNSISNITFVDAGVGYILAGALLFATIDGGLTWTQQTTGSRIGTQPVGATAMTDLQVPCCKNKTATMNAVLITGIRTGAIGAIWQGGISDC